MLNKLLVLSLLLIHNSIAFAEISVDAWFDLKDNKTTKLQVSCNGKTYEFKVKSKDLEKSEQAIIEWFDDIKNNKCGE